MNNNNSKHPAVAQAHHQDEIELRPGTRFTDERYNSELLVVFVDDRTDTLLLRSGQRHQLTTKTQFKSGIGNRYKPTGFNENLKPETQRVAEKLKEKYEQMDGRKSDHKVEVLTELLSTIEDEDEDNTEQQINFDNISGVGKKAASALKDHNLDTVHTVREADEETIKSIPHMGEKNTKSLINHVTGGNYVEENTS